MEQLESINGLTDLLDDESEIKTKKRPWLKIILIVLSIIVVGAIVVGFLVFNSKINNQNPVEPPKEEKEPNQEEQKEETKEEQKQEEEEEQKEEQKEEEKEEEKQEEEENPPVSLKGFDLYLSTEKYLYVWAYPNDRNLIKFISDHKFKRVYIYVGCLQWDYDQLSVGELYTAGEGDAKSIISELISMGVEVEPVIYLNDGPNNFANVEKMEDIAKAMGELQKTLPFKALHYDIEPSSKGNYEKLLKMYETARKYIKVSAILKPLWLNQGMAELQTEFTDSAFYNRFKDCPTFIDAIMMVTDYSDLMAYSDTYDKTDAFLNKYKEIIARHPGHESKPVLELDPEVKNDSIFNRYFEDHDTFFNYLFKVSKDFGAVTIHQYQVWYKDLYCDKVEKYTNYYFGEPKTCPIS